MSSILIVDDMPKNIQMAMNILKNEGYKMYYAKDAKMAIKQLHTHKIDLILLDIMMPDVDGFELCQELKSSKDTAGIPIIFLSGRDSTEDIQKAYEVGGADYIVKPFINIELLKKVSTQIELIKLKEAVRDA